MNYGGWGFPKLLHGTFHLQQLLSVLGLPDRRRKKVIHEFVTKKHPFLAFRVLIRPIYPIFGRKMGQKVANISRWVGGNHANPLPKRCRIGCRIRCAPWEPLSDSFATTSGPNKVFGPRGRPDFFFRARGQKKGQIFGKKSNFFLLQMTF